MAMVAAVAMAGAVKVGGAVLENRHRNRSPQLSPHSPLPSAPAPTTRPGPEGRRRAELALPVSALT